MRRIASVTNAVFKTVLVLLSETFRYENHPWFSLFGPVKCFNETGQDTSKGRIYIVSRGDLESRQITQPAKIQPGSKAGCSKWVLEKGYSHQQTANHLGISLRAGCERNASLRPMNRRPKKSGLILADQTEIDKLPARKQVPLTSEEISAACEAVITLCVRLVAITSLANIVG